MNKDKDKDLEDLEVYRDEWQRVMEWITKKELEADFYDEIIEENASLIERLERLVEQIKENHG